MRKIVSAGFAALTFACVFSLVAINERTARSPAFVLAQAGPQYKALPSFSDKQGTNRAFIDKADGSGQSTKGHVQMLASIMGTGAAHRHLNTKNGRREMALPSFSDKQGTNRAFISKFDGKGQSTKGRVQMLSSIYGSGWINRAKASSASLRAHKTGNYIALPEAGTMGTNKAFVNKGDGKGLRGTSKLSGFGTDVAFLHKGDGKGQSTKGKKQQLYEWTADMEGTYLPASDLYTGAGTKQIQLSGPGFAHALTDETNLGGIPGLEPSNVLPFASSYVIGH